ncbi:ribosomal protein S2, flavodoxin-like domain-containing protein [Naematelia encephala]|uniref:Ribosomal protein S2, flavodoxin-like domain-containing protein n=1 Tax=Naematelia encephala TaxID=71784 RepID=A0A1Y2B6Z6_9TREE|nr:ribosomal protein S2, flavodoxin-like domain-containing protein [Naematelia encephala]
MQAFRRRKAAMHINTPFIPPSSKPIPSPSPLNLTLSTLLASGAALGHSPSLLHAAFAPYVYGTRSGLSIIDLDQTLPLLRRAASLVRDVVKADGIVLMVGTKPSLRKMLEKGKERLGDNGYIARDWVPGLLTNTESIFGIKPMLDRGFLPDLVIFLNPADVRPGLRECVIRNIPTVGIIDSDMDPRNVTYPIPANQESVRTAELILGTLTLAGQEGRRMRLKEAEAKAEREKERRARDREDMRRRAPPRRGRDEVEQ